MTTANASIDQKDVLIEPRNVEIDVSTEGGEQTIVVPPISKLRKLHGHTISHWSTTFRRLEVSDADIDAAKREFHCLFKDYDEFRVSGAFLNRLASLAALIGDHDSANKFHSEAVAVSDIPELFYRFADHELTELSNFDSAVSKLEKLEAQGFVRDSLRLAECDLAAEKVDRASARIKDVLQTEPDDWRANLIGGVLALVDGKYPIAIRMLRTSLESRPNSPSIAANLAIAHYFQGNTRQTIKSIRRAIGLDPWNEKFLVFLADVVLEEQDHLYSDREMATALRLLSQFLHKNPESVMVAARTTKLALDTGNPKPTIRVLENTVRRSRTAETLNNLAVLLWASGDRRRALTNLLTAAEVVLKGGPEVAEDVSFLVAGNLVHLLNETGDARKAEQISLKLLDAVDQTRITAERDLSKIYFGYILSLAFQRKYPAMLDLVTKLIDRGDLYPTFKVNLATSLTCYHAIVTGDFEKAAKYALTAYEALSEVDRPTTQMVSIVTNNLTYSLIETNDLDSAQSLLKKLRTLEPDSYLVSATSGLYHIRRGHLEKGEEKYRLAMTQTRNEDLSRLLKKKLQLELAKATLKVDKKRAIRLIKSGLKISSTGGPWDAEGLNAELRQMIQD